MINIRKKKIKRFYFRYKTKKIIIKLLKKLIKYIFFINLTPILRIFIYYLKINNQLLLFKHKLGKHKKVNYVKKIRQDNRLFAYFFIF